MSKMLDEHLHSKLTESVDSLPLSTRPRNALLRSGIRTVSDLLSTPERAIKAIRNVGEKTFREIQVVRDELESSLSLEEKRLMGLIRSLPGPIASKLANLGINEFADLSQYTVEELVIHAGLTYSEVQQAIETLSTTEFALSTRWPEHPLVSSSDYQFLKRVGIPLGDIGVSRLALPSDLEGRLRLLGLETVDAVASQSKPVLKAGLGFYGEEYVDILARNLGAYFAWLLTQGNWDGEIASQESNPFVDKLLDLGVNELADLSQYTVEELVIHAGLTYFEVQQAIETLSTIGFALSTRWPEHPLVSSSDYQFLKRVGIPLGDIGVSRLALPSDLEGRLRLLGLETVDAVASQSKVILQTVLGDCGEEHIDTLVKNLRAYFKWLLTQSNWDDEIANQGVSPLYFVWLKGTTLERVIEGLLSYIPHDKYRKVIRLRFGLDGEGRRTLQQIGEQLGVTRERIRQMEKGSTGELEGGRNDGLIQALRISIEDEMRIRGGLISVTQIGEHIADLMNIGEVDQDGAVSLLLSLEPDQFVEVQKRKRWGLKDAPLNLVRPITQELVKVLQAVHAPLPQVDLIDRLTQTEWYAQLEDEDQPSTEFIIACLSTNDRFEETEDGRWGLTRWRKERTDEIVMALRELGKPSHHTEIARITNEMLPPSLRTSNRNIYAQLQQKSNLFVWVGPGTYGLAEWGLKRPRFYVDIAEELLEQRGEPLAFEEIFPAINAEREASPESIKFMLDTNPRFHQYPENKFGLASWLEEPDEEDEIDDPFLEDLKRRLLFDDFSDEVDGH